jgi:uncharacterized membrane protein
VASVILPVGLAGAALVGGLLASTQPGFALRAPRIARSTLVLLAWWLIIPIATLGLVSVLTSAQVIQVRYTLAAAPSAVLLIAYGLRAVRPAGARRILAMTIAMFAVLGLSRLHHSVDWRGSLAVAREVATEDSLLVLQPGFTESNQPEWRVDEEKRSFLAAPLSAYPLAGDVVILPQIVDTGAQASVAAEVRGAVDGDTDRIVLVGTHEAATWLAAVLEGDGWRPADLATVDDPRVTSFTRAQG